MAKSLGALTLDIVAKTGKLEKGTKRSRKNINQLRSSAKKAGKGIKIGFAAATAAVTAFGAASYKAARQQMQLIDEQATLARSVDGTVTGLRAVKLAAEDTGIDGLSKSVGKLNRRLGKATRDGTGPAADALADLGLQARDLMGMDIDGQFAAIADAVQNSGKSTQQLTRDLQGLGFKQEGVLQLFRQGGDAIEGYRGEVEELGLAVDELEVQRIKDAEGAFMRLGKLIDGVKTQLAIQLAPIIGAIADRFLDAGKEGADMGEIVAKGVNIAIKAIGFCADVVEGVKRAFDLAAKTGILAFFEIKKGVLKFVHGGLEPAISGINKLIEASNTFLHTDYSKISILDDLQSEIDTTESAIDMVKKDIDDLLMEPMPSSTWDEFIVDARTAADEAARANLEASKANRGAIDIPEIGQQDDAASDGMTGPDGEDRKPGRAGEMQAQNDQIDEEYAEAERKERRHQVKLTEVQGRWTRERSKAAGDAMSNLSSLMESENKTMFKVGKAAAMSQTVVQTHTAAMKAYQALAGIPIVGPALGAAAAAAAYATGAMHEKKISSRSFSTGSSGGGSGASSATAEKAAQGSANDNGQSSGGAPAPTTKHYLRGIDPSQMYDGQQILDVLNNTIRDGGKLAGVS